MVARRILLLITFALGVSTTNCAGICSDTADSECSRIDLDAISASSAASAASMNGAYLSIVEVTENADPAEGTCYARLQPIHIEGAPGATSLELGESEVWTSCSVGGREFFMASPLGDIRETGILSRDVGATGWYGQNGKPMCGLSGSVKHSS